MHTGAARLPMSPISGVGIANRIGICELCATRSPRFDFQSKYPGALFHGSRNTRMEETQLLPPTPEHRLLLVDQRSYVRRLDGQLQSGYFTLWTCRQPCRDSRRRNMKQKGPISAADRRRLDEHATPNPHAPRNGPSSLKADRYVVLPSGGILRISGTCECLSEEVSSGPVDCIRICRLLLFSPWLSCR
jgi:hypothetical protein